ncbi:MAG: phage major capsid protein [Candidatus Dormibacteria bacterium]
MRRGSQNSRLNRRSGNRNMAFNDQINRAGAQALMPEQVANEILQNVTDQSAALQLFQHVPMSRAQYRMPVLAMLPQAFWVTGDTGLKQTSKMAWDNKFLDAEEVAVITPIPENVLDDSGFPIWAQVQPKIEEAIAYALDAAVFLGINKPASWPAAISPAAIAAGNFITRGANTQAQGGVAQDVSDVMGLVEADGFDVDGFVAARLWRSKLRGARDTLGQRLLDVDMAAGTLDGQPIKYAMRGLWGTAGAAAGDPELIAGDFTQGMIGVRQDITVKVLDQAALQDNTGAIVFNLAQQDGIALRVKARFAFQVANVINRANPDPATRYPFGVVRRPV